jgi:lipoprotein-anchoring transpeptidase ErfK/SrfK
LPEQAKLEALSYKTLLEALAERYHSTPALLQRLNPGVQFVAGDEITVPNVPPMVIPAPEPPKPARPEPKGTSGRSAEPAAPPKPDVVVTVSKSTSALTVTDASGKVVMYAPVTTGSEHDPLPIGEWKVNGVSLNPPFRYNPELFWDADPTHTAAVLKPGPNNPVGVVWIDLSKEHYGIHGTPEPSTIGKSASHGCVRMTNWDALKLAGLVKPGTRVVFTP